MSQQQPLPPQPQSPPQTQQSQPRQMQPPFTQPELQAQAQVQRPSLTPSVSTSSQSSRSGDPQKIKEANARLLRRHREIVSRTDDFLGFMGVMNSAQGNLRKWLDNTKAYYAEARPLCALKTLKTLWGLEETDFFHVSMGIDFDPRVGAFKEVMQIVQKYTAYFARENNEEWTVRYLLESINPEIRFAPSPPVALRGLPASQLAIVTSSRSAESPQAAPVHPAIFASTSSAAANSPTAASFNPAAAAYSGSAPNSTVGPSEVVAPHLYLAAQDSISAHGQPQVSPPVPPQVPMANPAPMTNPMPVPVAPSQAPTQVQLPAAIQPIAPHMSTPQPATPTVASPQNAGAAPTVPPSATASPAVVAPAAQAVVAASTSATMPAPSAQASPLPQPSSSAQPAPATPVAPTTQPASTIKPAPSAQASPPPAQPSSSAQPTPSAPTASAATPSAPPPKPRRPRKMDAEARKRMLAAEAARREQKTAQSQSQSPQIGAGQEAKVEPTQSPLLGTLQSQQTGTMQSTQMAKAQSPQVEIVKAPKVESAQSPLARTVQELPNRTTQSPVHGETQNPLLRATQSPQAARTASPQATRTASPQAGPSRQTTPAQASKPAASTSPAAIRPSTLRQSMAPLEQSDMALQPEAIPQDTAPTQDAPTEPTAQEDVDMADANEVKMELTQTVLADETSTSQSAQAPAETGANVNDVQMRTPLEDTAPLTAMDVDQRVEPPVPQPTIAVSEAKAGQPQIETETAAQPATEGHRPLAAEDLLPPAAYGLRPPAAEGPHPPAVEGLLPPAAYGLHTPADVSMAAPEDPGATLSRATSSSFASPVPKSPPQRALTPVPPPDDVGLRVCGFTFAGGSTVEKCTFNWAVKPAQVASVKAWNNRNQCTTDFSRAYRDASCITLGCYAASDLPTSIKDNRYHITSKRPSWPTRTKVRLTIQAGNKERVLSLSPPFKLTPDGLFDLTPYSVSGANQVTLYLYRAPGDTTDYCFHLYGHRPTPAMVEQVVRAQRRGEEWRETLEELGRPFDFGLAIAV
ncbi:hypothetical protein GGF50DRAFT_110356 [Schizophyllum commune]